MRTSGNTWSRRRKGEVVVVGLPLRTPPPPILISHRVAKRKRELISVKPY
jgi:hypothetical protein